MRAVFARSTGRGGEMLKIKRAYEKKGPADGKRILVDRLWPRGVTKAEAGIDVWMRDLAPSDELRKWFGHNPEKWEEFKKRYAEELSASDKKQALEGIARESRRGRVTLVFGARDAEHSNARFLEELVAKMSMVKA